MKSQPNRLNKKLRTRWDELINAEGKTLGLSGCRPFLENKLINDIFYEGLYKGRPCIVKCSSRDPESICIEFNVLIRLHKKSPNNFPEPFCVFLSEDARFAFLAMEKIIPTVDIKPSVALNDILTIANTLQSEGIVHRDIYHDNIFIGKDGHLKLIDFQFAIDRKTLIVTSWLKKHWKYHYIIFARTVEQLPATWNDVTSLRRFIRKKFSNAPDFVNVDTQLARIEPEESIRIIPSARLLPAIILYLISLWMQCKFCQKATRKEKLVKRMHASIKLIKYIISEKI
jgi:serine/threonine protein kinase